MSTPPPSSIIALESNTAGEYLRRGRKEGQAENDLVPSPVQWLFPTVLLLELLDLAPVEEKKATYGYVTGGLLSP